MAAASFYHNGGKPFELAYFNHGTKQSNVMLDVCKEFADTNHIGLHIGTIQQSKVANDSWEAYWRRERYGWLRSIGLPIVTAHHLDDCIETWIFSCLHGNPKLPMLSCDNVFRPFLTTSKRAFECWCRAHNVSYIHDHSNDDTRFPRNRIRHVILPECLKVNPGIEKVVRRKVLDMAREMGIMQV